ncbi:MAG: aminopeptidase P family protein [Oscillospiraceae bacterium]|nr:aminopeptidase P family protein [Oscillospiraceae bacterium]
MTRIEKLRAKLGEGFSAALVEHSANRWYLSEFSSSAGTLIITEDDALFIADFRYIEAAQKTVTGAKTALQEPEADRQIGNWLKAKRVGCLMVESEMPLSRFKKLKTEFEDIALIADGGLSDAVLELRSVKEQKELEAVKSAQAITDAAFSFICGFIKPGLSEREIVAELEYFMRKNGADALAFDSIVVSGPNSSMPHGVPGDRKIRAGDFITMDYGAKKDGYCSDMTRTVAVGFATDEMRRVYDVVHTAHLTAREHARAGMSGRELDKVARDVIYGAGYEGHFGHGLGHSLGLEIHERPRASPLFDQELVENVIMTIEPGVYLPGRFGVRIENMVLLKAGSNENLTGSPTELIVL